MVPWSRINYQVLIIVAIVRIITIDWACFLINYRVHKVKATVSPTQFIVETITLPAIVIFLLTIDYFLLILIMLKYRQHQSVIDFIFGKY